ncbi:MAG: hypothetical protein ABSG57_12195 [Candidatus Bathyarchaeia archaeon]
MRETSVRLLAGERLNRRVGSEKLGTAEADRAIACVDRNIVRWKKNGITDTHEQTKTTTTPQPCIDETTTRYAKDFCIPDLEVFGEFFEQKYYDPEKVLGEVVRSVTYDDDDELREVTYNVLRDVCLDAAKTSDKCKLCGEKRYKTEKLAIPDEHYTAPEVVCTNSEHGCGYVFASVNWTPTTTSDDERWTLRDLELRKEIRDARTTQNKREWEEKNRKIRNAQKRTWRHSHPLTVTQKARRTIQQRERRGLWAYRTPPGRSALLKFV